MIPRWRDETLPSTSGSPPHAAHGHARRNISSLKNDSVPSFQAIASSSPICWMFVGSRRISTIISPQIYTDETQIQIRIQEFKICENPCPPVASLSVALIVHQRSRCRRAPASRLPQRQPESLASCPSKVAEGQREIPFAGDRAARVTGQSIFGTLLPCRPAAGWSSAPGWTIVAAQATLPFVRATYRARTRTYSPRLPHLPQAKRADAFLHLPRSGSSLAPMQENPHREKVRTAEARAGFCSFVNARRNANAPLTAVPES